MRAVHPGEILREDILPEIKMTESRLAEHLNVSRMTVNRLINEVKRSILWQWNLKR